MANKTIPIITYLVYSIFSATVYGIFAFFVIYRGLAGEVMMNAYLWNILFIIGFLVLDKFVNDVLLSKELVITKKIYLAMTLVHTVTFISYKTTLYLFYIFVLIASRVSLLSPELVADDFRNFVLSIEYCLILVVVFDKFIEYLIKEDVRIKRISTKFTRFTNFVARKRGKFKKTKE